LENVGLIFDLQGVQTFADVISDLNSGDLRIGLHVQAIGTDGESDSFITGGVTRVPEAGTLLLLGAGLLGLWAVRRRK
jgi:hypothetical protein